MPMGSSILRGSVDAFAQVSRLLFSSCICLSACEALQASAASSGSKPQPPRPARPVQVPPCVHATLPSDQERPRTIIVGDIHGCLEELVDLLRLCEYDEATCRVVLVGDLVNKGPLSAECVAFARASGFACVRGNHDDAALFAWERRQKALQDGESPPAADAKYAYTDKFTRADVDFLKELPYTLHLPSEATLVVHAGLVPGMALSEQPLLGMYTMRDVLRVNDDAEPDALWQWTPKHEGEAWASIWGPEAARALGVGPVRQVVFGHDARRGLQECAHAVGLDTGCCYGKRLSALVLPERRFVSVEARRIYSKPASSD